MSRNSASSGATIADTASTSSAVDSALPRKTESRGTGESSSARIVSFSRSRSNARPRPIVPVNAIATHSMPGTEARAARGSTGNANE